MHEAHVIAAIRLRTCQTHRACQIALSEAVLEAYAEPHVHRPCESRYEPNQLLCTMFGAAHAKIHKGRA